MKVVSGSGVALDPREFVATLHAGALQSGAYWVSGPSSEVGATARELLERDGQVAYFLIAGWPESRVACFRRFERSVTPRAPEPTDVLDLSRTLPSGQQVFDEFERAVLGSTGGVTSIVVECLTPASDEESAFVRLALTSRLARHRPVIVLTHDRNSDPLDIPAPARRGLDILFLAGGRMRAADWHAAGLESDRHDLVDRRDVNGETWYTYASRKVAVAARRGFGTPPPSLVHAIAGQPWYPALRVGGRSHSLGELLEAYSPEALAAALADDPRAASRYFQRLQRVAAANGRNDVAHIATGNYVAVVSNTRPRMAYRVAASWSSSLTRELESDHAARLWFAIGQSLARDNEAEAQMLAVDAFHRSRDAAASLPSQPPARVRSRQAAAANGEALVAYKCRQVHRARGLEEAALRALATAGDSDELRSQRILLRSHLGDIYLRGLNDPAGALDAYRLAFEQALASPSDDELRYVVPRLASALLAAGHISEAAHALKQLILRARQRTASPATSSDQVMLKAYLTLAEAHLRSGDERSAAACYWRLVRSRRLAPATARGVAANLRQCHPRLSERADGALERILAQHESTAMVAGRVLAALHPIPSRILEPEVA